MNNQTDRDGPGTPGLARAAVAEALGTAFLLAGVVGSGIMAKDLAGSDEAVALLANMLATGTLLTVLILVFGPISGAHFNPAVTLVMTIRGDVSAGRAGVYVPVQIAAGLLGVIAAHLMFSLEPVQVSAGARPGAGRLLGEVVATFGLLATILGTLRYGVVAVAAGVGLFIASAYWFTSSTSFANPAVTIARAFTDTFTGIAPVHVVPFIGAQILGALLAWAVFGWLLDRKGRD